MSITSIDGPQFGTHEWWKYWEDQPKKDIICFLEFAIANYRDKSDESKHLQKMVTWLAMYLRDYIDFSGDEIIEMARKASENEA